MNNTKKPLLSICIPSYNRSTLAEKLTKNILKHTGNFEVCIHIDGSTDDSLERLQSINDPRLHLGYSPNQGRGGALYSAVNMAQGRFVMLFDDDDTLFHSGLDVILSDCARPLPDNCIGHVYHMEDENHQTIGTRFPTATSNFLKLRADHKILGDKKEVVLAEKLRSAMMDGKGVYRRIPTSLFWSRLALDGDVICHNQAIGSKTYLAGGMSHGIKKLKTANAWPMAILYSTHIRGFLNRRYKSFRYFGRAVVGLIFYTSLAIWRYFRRGFSGHA